jgi:hypothetical protein
MPYQGLGSSSQQGRQPFFGKQPNGMDLAGIKTLVASAIIRCEQYDNISSCKRYQYA